MDDNPYTPPKAESLVSSPLVAHLRRIAHYQSWLLGLGIAQLALVFVSQFLLHFHQIDLLLSTFYCAIAVVVMLSAVATFLLTWETDPLGHGLLIGIILGLFALMPCIGLIGIVSTYHRANATLQNYGVRVGLIGLGSDSFEMRMRELTQRGGNEEDF